MLVATLRLGSVLGAGWHGLVPRCLGVSRLWQESNAADVVGFSLGSAISLVLVGRMQGSAFLVAAPKWWNFLSWEGGERERSMQFVYLTKTPFNGAFVSH